MPTNLPRPRRPYTVGRLMAHIAACAVLLWVAVGFHRVVERAGEAARRAQCTGCLKQIAVALYNYESVHGVLPPAVVVDSHGNPLYSWRVLLLPYLQEKDLYAKFRLDEPWDSPANRRWLDHSPRTYRCPTRYSDAFKPPTPPYTGYVVPVGPGTLFPGTSSRRFADVTDGLGQTLMIVETAQADIPWSAPVDLDVQTGRLTGNLQGLPFPTFAHPSGYNVSTADGSIRVVRIRSLESLRAASTIAGGEPPDPDLAPYSP